MRSIKYLPGNGSWRFNTANTTAHHYLHTFSLSNCVSWRFPSKIFYLFPYFMHLSCMFNHLFCISCHEFFRYVISPFAIYKENERYFFFMLESLAESHRVQSCIQTDLQRTTGKSLQWGRVLHLWDACNLCYSEHSFSSVVIKKWSVNNFMIISTPA